MFGAGMLFLGVLLGVVGIAVLKSQVTYGLFILHRDFDVIMPNQSKENTFLVNTFSRGKRILSKP